MLVLVTTGRETGIPRRTCLIYGTSGDDFVVVASQGGAEENPEWFKNLEAEPNVGVQVGARRLAARARVAGPDERETLWAQMARIFPLYDEYAQKTDRLIPIVLPTPQGWRETARQRRERHRRAGKDTREEKLSAQ